MTCNHCSNVSNEAAKQAGAPEVEAAWAENRQHPRYCPTCHGFLRADGGCTRCDNTGVGSDAHTLALTAPPPAKVVFLSCGHLGGGRPGEQVWCTGCDDWAVAGQSGKRKFSLAGCCLNGSDLRDSNLMGASLRRVELTGADLRQANLREADLSAAFLSGADLRKADLRGAYLNGADLRKADLRGANLAGACLLDANLKYCTYDAKTIWPDDFTPPAQKE